MICKRVLFITHNCNFANSFLIPQIKLYKNLGCTVFLASSLDLGNPPIEVDKFFRIDIKQSPLKFQFNFRAFLQLKKIIFYEKIDVVNCHTPMGGVLGRLLKIPYPNLEIIYTAHGFHFYEGSSIFSWILFYPIEKFLSRYTDKLITINSEDFNLVNKKKFMSKKKYLVNGVGVETIKENNSEINSIISKYDLTNAYPIFTCIGQLNKNKNHRLAIESIKDILKIYPNTKLIIIGEGPLYNELNNLISNLKLSKNVILVGYTKHVLEFLSITKILISTSYREGLPKSVMEALNLGVPCLVSNCRGNRDLVKDNFNGYIFKDYTTNSLIHGVKIILNDYETLKYNTTKSIKPFLLESIIDDYNKIFLEDL